MAHLKGIGLTGYSTTGGISIHFPLIRLIIFETTCIIRLKGCIIYIFRIKILCSNLSIIKFISSRPHYRFPRKKQLFPRRDNIILRWSNQSHSLCLRANGYLTVHCIINLIVLFKPDLVHQRIHFRRSIQQRHILNITNSGLFIPRDIFGSIH